MAKKKSAATATKSDAIRDVLKEQPAATVNEIQAALKKRGVKASDALVNKIRYGRKAGGTRGKKSRGRRSTNGAVNKAEAIRGMWRELGAHARNRDVMAALAKQGVNVSSAQVSTLRKTASRRTGSTIGAADSVSLEHLLAARKMADQLGGIEVARKAMASFAKLMG